MPTTMKQQCDPGGNTAAREPDLVVALRDLAHAEEGFEDLFGDLEEKLTPITRLQELEPCGTGETEKTLVPLAQDIRAMAERFKMRRERLASIIRRLEI